MVITSADMDVKLKYKISKIPGAEKIMLCFQCGTCTADCPIARFSDSYRPRKILRMIQLGMKDKVLSSDVIWLCATCYTCVDHCPQDVGVASVMRALQNLATKKDNVPTVYRELASNILKTGYAYRVPELRLRKRREQGLPPLPKANLENVEKIFNITGSLSLLKPSNEENLPFHSGMGRLKMGQNLKEV